ncbi:MAG: hypothetical protein R2748_11975 [Bryobacterales bacterium]
MPHRVSRRRRAARALIPTFGRREGDWLYVHGSNKNRALRAMIGGDACLGGVMLLDGFV